MKFIKTILLAMITFGLTPGNGQAVPPGLELQELVRIAEVYDQSPNLAFNLKYTYADSLTYTTYVDSNFFIYKLSLGKTLMSNSQMEFLQNSNYVVYVDKLDSSVSVTKRSSQSTLFQIPLLDSNFRKGHVDSIAVNGIGDSLWRFKVYFKSESPYLTYDMDYNPFSGLVKVVNYHVRNLGGAYNLPSDHIICATYTMTNYSFVSLDASLFNENRYFYILNGVQYLQPMWSAFILHNN